MKKIMLSLVILSALPAISWAMMDTIDMAEENQIQDMQDFHSQDTETEDEQLPKEDNEDNNGDMMDSENENDDDQSNGDD